MLKNLYSVPLDPLDVPGCVPMQRECLFSTIRYTSKLARFYSTWRWKSWNMTSGQVQASWLTRTEALCEGQVYVIFMVFKLLCVTIIRVQVPTHCTTHYCPCLYQNSHHTSSGKSEQNMEFSKWFFQGRNSACLIPNFTHISSVKSGVHRADFNGYWCRVHWTVMTQIIGSDIRTSWCGGDFPTVFHTVCIPSILSWRKSLGLSSCILVDTKLSYSTNVRQYR